MTNYIITNKILGRDSSLNINDTIISNTTLITSSFLCSSIKSIDTLSSSITLHGTLSIPAISYNYTPPITNGLIAHIPMGTTTNVINVSSSVTLTGTTELINGVYRLYNTSGTAANNLSNIQAPSFSNIRTISLWYYQHSGIPSGRYLLDTRSGLNEGFIYAGSGQVGAGWVGGKLYINGGSAINITSINRTNLYTTQIEKLFEWRNITVISSNNFTDDITLFGRFTQNEALDVSVGPILIYNTELTEAENKQNYDYYKEKLKVFNLVLTEPSSTLNLYSNIILNDELSVRQLTSTNLSVDNITRVTGNLSIAQYFIGPKSTESGNITISNVTGNIDIGNYELIMKNKFTVRTDDSNDNYFYYLNKNGTNADGLIGFGGSSSATFTPILFLGSGGSVENPVTSEGTSIIQSLIPEVLDDTIASNIPVSIWKFTRTISSNIMESWYTEDNQQDYTQSNVFNFNNNSTALWIISSNGSWLAQATGSAHFDLPLSSADPVSSYLRAGSMYFNEVDNVVKIYDGTNWNTLTYE